MQQHGVYMYTCIRYHTAVSWAHVVQLQLLPLNFACIPPPGGPDCFAWPLLVTSLMSDTFLSDV